MPRLDRKQSVSSLRVLTTEGCLPREANSKGPRCGFVFIRISTVSPVPGPLLIIRTLDGTLRRIFFGEEMLEFLPHSESKRVSGMMLMRLGIDLSQCVGFGMLRSNAHYCGGRPGSDTSEGQSSVLRRGRVSNLRLSRATQQPADSDNGNRTWRVYCVTVIQKDGEGFGGIRKPQRCYW
jgi:hypothetical protein